nr:TRAP transporter small permease [Aquincola tertiaricarbonis]
MAALVLITFANVVVRYFSNQSFAWTEEISVFLMIVMTLVGGCAAVARDRHIKIEYLLEVGSDVRRLRLRRFGALCTSGFFLLLGGLSVRMVWDEFRYGETTPAIGLPSWWFSIWLPLLSLAIAGRALGLYRRLGAR